MMKKIILSIAAAAAAFAVSGCASGVKLSELSPEKTELLSDKSQIVIYRTQVLGAAIQPTIDVDSNSTEKCTPRGVFVVDVQPGQHTVSASTESKTTLQVNAPDAGRVYVRCSIGFGLLVGRPKLELIDNATGQNETRELSFTGRY